MTKRRNSIVLLLLVLIGLSGCFEFRIPEIGPIVPPKVEIGPYEFFVTSMTVNFDTLLSYIGDELPLNDYREAYPDDPSGRADWFVMRDTFSTDFDMDMGMEVDAVSSSISQSMGFIDFTTRNFNLSEPIEMQDIIDLSALPDGTPVPIDSVAIDPDTSYTNFPMVRQQFSEGTLEVTLNNNLQCQLGVPISITLYDSLTAEVIQDGVGDTLRILWDTHIAPGANSTKSASLAGVEFPSTIMIITEGVICGSGHDTVLTVSDDMKTSSFSASGSISGLVGEFVEGDLDPQILNDTSVISFGDDLDDPNLSVEKVYLDTCHVKIEITNTSSITGKMLLNLMSLDISDDPGIQHFTTDSLIIPSGTTSSTTFNLYNSSIDITSDFEYRTHINIPGQYGQLDASDEFLVEFSFYGKNPGDPIGIESVDATFSDMEYTFDDMTMDIGLGDMFPEEFSGIELSTIDLSLDINSSITIPMTLDMNLIGVKNAGADSMALSVNQQITGVGGNNHIIFAGAADLINFKPDSLIFNGNISLDGTGNMPLTQNIGVEGMFAVPFQFEINSPLSFAMPYTALQLDELPAFLDDFTGSIEAAVNNSFQFGVDFLVLAARDTNYFDNAAYTDCVRTIADLTIPAIDTTTQQLVLTKEDYDFIAHGEDSTWLSMNVALTGRTDGVPTTFLTTDSVSLSLFIRAEGTLDFSELDLDSLGSDTSGGGQ
ncbi:MAG: hypothetical protein DRP93_05200 [Candidatus Neomarinimicrobiota bacterium]|nr:MAG: hypothetical protein DRP93_05200 [Candidatus Neomarinimicrobiota bacterium]